MLLRTWDRPLVPPKESMQAERNGSLELGGPSQSLAASKELSRKVFALYDACLASPTPESQCEIRGRNLTQVISVPGKGRPGRERLGHQWEVRASKHLTTTRDQLVCPVCGSSPGSQEAAKIGAESSSR